MLPLRLACRIVCCLVIAVAASAVAQDKTESPYFEVDATTGAIDPLPLLGTQVHVDIDGVIANVTVKQRYQNRGSAPINARYVFPGSTRAAVHRLTMRVGDDVVRAQIREKVAAQHEFDEAKAAGKTATLLTEERPNVFTMNLANVMPGDVVDVELGYTELLVPERKVYSFVYPTVVGPRYHGAPSTDDTAMPQPHYGHEGVPPKATFELTARIRGGVPLRELGSPSHQLLTSWRGKSEASLKLKPDPSNGTKDVVIEYSLMGEAVASGLMLSKGSAENFFLLTVQPPKRVDMNELPAREYVFVVDVSGSMGGFPLATAKHLLHELAGTLTPNDRFNILFFSGGANALSEASLPATKENVRKGLSMLDRVEASGGTELLPALKRAFAMPADRYMARSFIVITDGYVTVEREAFELVAQSRGQANVFAFGIGTSVNRYIIEGIAKAGMGEPFFVLNADDATKVANALREYVQAPVLTHVQADLTALGAYDVQPQVLPDVLADRPIVIQGKWRSASTGKVTVRGVSGQGPWQQSFDVATAPVDEAEALKYLWARSRIAAVSDFNVSGAATEDERAEVLKLGLTYGLLTKYTSFIAVLQKVRAPVPASTTVDQPLPMPEGVSDMAVSDEDLEHGDEPPLWLLAVPLALGLWFANRARRQPQASTLAS